VKFCEEHSSTHCEHLLPNKEKVFQQIIDRLDRSLWQECPQCSIPSLKSDGCTHMECSRCKAKWCYFCRGALRAVQGSRYEWCFNGCPWFLDRIDYFNQSQGGASEELVLFHHLKALRLLRTLRQEVMRDTPDISFDDIFQSIPIDRRTITLVAKGDTEFSKVVELNEIITPPVQSFPYYKPRDRIDPDRTLNLEDFP